MCGFCGILANGLGTDDIAALPLMNATLQHRGPDDEGYVVVDPHISGTPLRGDDTVKDLAHFEHVAAYRGVDGEQLAMAHRRLSIIDESARGHQPMEDPETRSWIVYNGEIYNYVELRSELEGLGHAFRTDTDTEVILKSYRQWGYDCLHRFNGMWAFALWDHEAKTLFCSRDRFGVKPFYYSLNDRGFFFSSEIKALLRHDQVPAKANDRIIWDYLVLTLIDHSDETFFDGILQLPSGHYLTIDVQRNLKVRRYYTLEYADEIGHHETGTGDTLGRQFIQLLDDAVRIRLRSDVPVASYLSGGIDSSAILSLVNGHLDKLPYTFRTFSAAYDDPRYDESSYVHQVLEGKDVLPIFHKPSLSAMAGDLDRLVRHQEEPFISTAIYAQWSLLKTISEHGLKVILTGDGADEVLCGYPDPYVSLFFLDLLRHARLRDFLGEARAIGAVPTLRNTAKGLYWHLPSLLRFPVRAHFRAKPKIVNRDFLHAHREREELWMDTIFRSSLQRRLYLDMTRFLLPHELRFREKNAMAFSVEERQPYLDYRVVEFCYRLPAVYKIHRGWRKHLLRSSTSDLLPPSIRWRRNKLGFGTSELRWYTDIRDVLDAGSQAGSRYFDRGKLDVCSRRLSKSNPGAMVEMWSFYNLSLWIAAFAV